MSHPTSRRVTFPSRIGHLLVGRAVEPSTTETGQHWALLSHCFTCGKDLKGYHYLCRGLAALGWASLRFDFTGLGESGGAFGDTSLDSNVTDLEDAAAYLATSRASPRLLIGHSLGGAAALLAAGNLPSLAGLVLLGAPSDLSNLPQAVPEILTAAEEARPVAATIGGRRVQVGPQLLPSLTRQDLRATLAELQLPVLVLHAPRDEVVPYNHAQRLAAWAGPRGTLVPLEAADHLLSSPAQAEAAANAIVTWAGPIIDHG